MSSTRYVKVGSKTIRIDNVPDDITDDELKKYAFRKLAEVSKDRAIKEMVYKGMAS